MNKVTRVWMEILPNDIRKKNNSLSSFKAILWKYYTSALSNCYYPDNSRTWKSVCVHFSKARSLHARITCCF